MPSIIIRRDGKPAKEFVLEKGLTLIGQNASADIRIEDADGIEERASILQVGNDFILNELGPADGTLVNGQPVRKCVLKDRDLISIGEYRMTFQNKHEDDMPVGIEMELAEKASLEEPLQGLGKSAAPLRAGSSKKAELVTYLVVGAIVAGIVFASYQSYVDRQAAEAQAVLAKKAYLEALRREAEKQQENTRTAAESPIKPAEAPPAPPVTEQKN